MKKIIINGVELEFDIYDADTFEKYDKLEKAVSNIKEEADKIHAEQGFAAYIRFISGTVKGGFDDIFGQGTAEKVCGKGDSLVVSMESFADLSNAVTRQTKELEANSKIQEFTKRGQAMAAAKNKNGFAGKRGSERPRR